MIWRQKLQLGFTPSMRPTGFRWQLKMLLFHVVHVSPIIYSASAMMLFILIISEKNTALVHVLTLSRIVAKSSRQFPLCFCYFEKKVVSIAGQRSEIYLSYQRGFRKPKRGYSNAGLAFSKILFAPFFPEIHHNPKHHHTPRVHFAVGRVGKDKNWVLQSQLPYHPL